MNIIAAINKIREMEAELGQSTRINLIRLYHKKDWQNLGKREKREVLKRSANEDIGKVLREIKSGQKQLF